ncbi:proline--tRNA ligase, cytoplasmic-like [Trifolium pratense]|uniref:proline--tRNA ligase, cytoplasmic-like n=1 Tax=Trifolium pratense TaxID=57577 RepID=UPI001E691F7E|nr:proline--tRNA ligase, cytoplasmic-like [Trifolium pratense]XP_045805043.1 proline--tRNA ligase, cytoplasmic-like [Trifolium pratense]XP_045805045.1 proline--tRNA ligase, cytoplasmic-like [Trifolium pratense]
MAGTEVENGGNKELKEETSLGLTYRKAENFDEWYSEVVVSAELIEHYDISGLYILRPLAVEIWETLQAFFDSEIKKMKVENCYFPTFVLESHLKKEEDHYNGFSQEVAWVTKSGKSDLETHLALRPSSETIMYSYFSKWIRGHRDLPLKLNQWCNAVRWAVGDPTPFIRSREFLWQEGHSAFATEDEAHAEALEILELYRRIYEEYLAVPVIKGTKSEVDTFGGAIYTNTVEAFIPNTGCGIQGATTHCLGQKFASKFELNFEDKKGDKAMVWQNSWGYSTRTIGVTVMVHGDDKGLVLPPKVASTQVIVIPVPYKDADTQEVYDTCKTTVNMLCEAKIRAELDSRDYLSLERKSSEWEMKGVPLRIEIGSNDLADEQVCVVQRHNGAKMGIAANADLVEEIKKMLNNIQQNMFDVAKRKQDECIQVIQTWDEFVEALHQRKIILAPWCDDKVVELDVKEKTENEMGAVKILCSPFDQPKLLEGTKCFASGKPAKKWTYWGRSY